MKSSIKDVAERCGLSVVTVSRVLNNVPTVRRSNREKVLRAIKELNYTPSVAARTLALGKTKVIGLTISNLNNLIIDGIVKSISKCLEENGYLLAVSIVSNKMVDRGDLQPFLFQEGRVDGVIFLTPVNQEAQIRELRNKNIPFVLIDNQRKQGDVISVIVNNHKGAYEATRHLIELGHKKIAHIGGPEFFLCSRNRRQGYLDALEESGIQPFAIKESKFSVKGGFDITKKWLREDNYPTAIFAADDFIALGAINALQEAGLRVPEDVSVIGFDDQEFSKVLSPQLTTVKQPQAELGRKSVELLLSMINGSNITPGTVMFDPELLFRQTTAQYNGENVSQ